MRLNVGIKIDIFYLTVKEMKRKKKKEGNRKRHVWGGKGM